MRLKALREKDQLAADAEQARLDRENFLAEEEKERQKEMRRRQVTSTRRFFFSLGCALFHHVMLELHTFAKSYLLSRVGSQAKTTSYGTYTCRTRWFSICEAHAARLPAIPNRR